MIAKLCVTFGVLVYALLIPFLEINDSHVFNQSWPPHARLHEAWQLATHCGLGMLALWLAWWRQQVRLAGALNILVMGGVLVAHGMAGVYGGSVHSGNLETAVLGVPLAVFVAALVVSLAAVAQVLARPHQGDTL